MAAAGGSSHGSDGRWEGSDDRKRRGDDDRRRHKEHRRHRDDHPRFNIYQFLQMGPKPLVGGESPEVTKDWLARVENCFQSFCCSEQQMEAQDFLVDGSTRKWWQSISAAVQREKGKFSWDDFRSTFQKKCFSHAVQK